MPCPPRGCGIIYKQPIYQGNLIEKQAVDQLQAGMSKQQVTACSAPRRSPTRSTPSAGTTSPASAPTASASTEVKNFTVYFENDALTRWEGEYFPEQDAELAKTDCASSAATCQGQEEASGGRVTASRDGLGRCRRGARRRRLSFGSASNGRSSSTRSPSQQRLPGAARAEQPA